MYLKGMLSVVARRFAAQFTKNKDYVFKDRSKAIYDIAKINGIFLVAQGIIAYLIAEFAYPTPDVIHDMRMALSEDFRNFFRYRGHGGMMLSDANAIHEYKTDCYHTYKVEKYGVQPWRVTTP